MLKITIAGVKGKMGSRILALAAADPSVEVAAVFEAPSSGAVGAELDFRGRRLVIGDSPGASLSGAEVLIDFTSPSASLSHLEAAAAAGRPVVLGTTGFDEKGVAAIKSFSSKIPLVFSPNMSAGVNLLFRLVAEAAAALPGYDAEIVELHHNQKKDAPSGTAAKIAEIIAGVSPKKNIYGRQGIVGARKKDELGVLAVRAGDIVGEHTVYFAGTGERLEITHRAHSRDCFASGALSAAKWLVSKKPGLYTMRDALGI